MNFKKLISITLFLISLFSLIILSVSASAELIFQDDQWNVFVDGEIDESYTGLAEYQSRWFYVKNGTPDREYTGVVKTEDNWYYVVNGVLDTTRTGFIKYDNKSYYVKSGVIEISYVGLVEYQGKQYYIKNGEYEGNYTGLAKSNGNWFYVRYGIFDDTFTGLAKNEYGWYYAKNGVLDKTYTGLALNEYGWFYVKNGVLNRTYTGLAKNEYGWFYVNKGVLDRTYTGLAYNQYGWFFVKNGVLNRTYTGLCKNPYGIWYVKNGLLIKTYTGMYRTTSQDLVRKNSWVYIQSGQYKASYTGVGRNDYGTWYFKNGSIAFSFTGTVQFGCYKYTVSKGKVTATKPSHTLAAATCYKAAYCIKCGAISQVAPTHDFSNSSTSCRRCKLSAYDYVIEYIQKNANDQFDGLPAFCWIIGGNEYNGMCFIATDGQSLQYYYLSGSVSISIKTTKNVDKATFTGTTYLYDEDQNYCSWTGQFSISKYKAGSTSEILSKKGSDISIENLNDTTIVYFMRQISNVLNNRAGVTLANLGFALK